MKVLYDTQIFASQRFGGVSRIFAELYREFSENEHGVEANIPPWFGNNEYARAYAMPQKHFITKQCFRGKTRLTRPFNRFFLKRGIHCFGPDLFHPTYYDPAFLDFIGDTPFVVTVFDMIHEKFGDSCFTNDQSTRQKKRTLIERASRLIAISETTKQDLITIYGTDPDLIDVVYPGISIVPRINESYCRSLDASYILYVGRRRKYKNFERFIYGIAPVLKRHDLTLLCVGGGSLTLHEKKIARDLCIENKIRQKFLNESELSLAYSHAELFVFPSLYEGFGMPLLEAFANSCPVVASDIPVFQEITAGAASYFDPLNAESIECTVEQALNNKDRELLVIAGRRRLSHFSWHRCAQETASAYEAAISFDMHQ